MSEEVMSNQRGQGGSGQLHDDLLKEYDRLADTVASFDQRLLTIKGWGVTFSLATLALGFQQEHYGLFLVAGAGAVGFWFIEASTKSHQLRYYPRMGDIERLAYDLYGHRRGNGVVASSPLIDWGWHTASQRLWGLDPRRFEGFSIFRWSKGKRLVKGCKDPHAPTAWPDVNSDPGVFDRILLWPHVALPHAIAAVLGLSLFVAGLLGAFGSI
jgi:hypothetical protein